MVDSGVARREGGGGRGLAGVARALPPIERLLRLRTIQHVAAARVLSALVEERARFLARELRGVQGAQTYTLRGSPARFVMRHGTADVFTLNEVFHLRIYDPPEPLWRRLSEIERPKILDLGGNVGMFSLQASLSHPGARITAWEPDRVNAELYSRVMALNPGLTASWRLVRACAGPREDQVPFLPGLDTESRMADAPVADSVTVPMRDVLPEFADADLIKIDIEGGEWELLADPRFAGARAVVMEYHPLGCPGEDPHRAAPAMLETHGLRVHTLFEHPHGFGMLWAWRED